MATTTLDWTAQLSEQLQWHWRQQLRPRLSGLTDDEYFWEPAQPAWNVHPRGTSTAPIQAGGGAFTVDFAIPEPDPPPVTTIAWRLAHVIVGVLGARSAAHFGGPPADYATFVYAGTAAEALDQLDDAYARWTAGVRGLDAAALAAPCGPAEGPFADYPMAALVLHISREVIHHGAEVALLRDLYRAHAG
jgi:DinB superfamily